MKVTYVITGLDWAGAEIQVRDLSLEMSKRGHIVQVVTLISPKAFVDELQSVGVQVRSLDLRRGENSPMVLAKSVLALRRFIHGSAPAIVHSHMVHANILTRLAVPFSNFPPLICTAHNIQEGGALRDWAYRLTNQWSKLNTTISNAATKRYLGDNVFGSKYTITVPNGINTEKFLPALQSASESSGIFRWIAVGRLHDQKDYGTLLSALRSVPDAQIDIAGQGPLLASLIELARKLGVNDRVNFLGLSKNLPELLPKYDGFVLSSAWEGFGLVVAEAMACGLPVVATRSGGPEEIIGEDETAGFLVPPQSSRELGEAMLRMAALPPEKRSEMGKTGRQRIVDKFSITAVTDQWTSIYESVATDNGRFREQ
jgi:glycosyltransferase involved in cell wall biosynthesis